jgi:CTP synthase
MSKSEKKRFIFVTGGVVSGVGKGILSASIGLILKSSGLKVDAVKMDPYLNVDCGTMSPYEHGEVYVLEDGTETDLDLGHYERFLEVNLKKNSSVTAGKIYSQIIERERKGDYLGKTVQIIPSVTNLIQEMFLENYGDIDVRMVEIGGSTGDIEAEIFLESLRQFRQHPDVEVLHVHVGYIPFLKACGEYKSKPMQTSLRELQRLGLRPDMIFLRSEASQQQPMSRSIAEKISLFSNIAKNRVIDLPDQKSIYGVPLHLINSSDIIAHLSEFTKQPLEPLMDSFYQEVNNKHQKALKVALIAKYVKLNDSYLSVIESLKIAAAKNSYDIEIQILDSEDPLLEQKMTEFDAFVTPGGFGKRGMEGKIKAIQWIRENKKPFLGICLGLQLSVVEFARHRCGIKANTAESLENGENKEGWELVVDYMTDQVSIQKLGGTMRLGNYTANLEQNSLARELYNSERVTERHRHRLEVQNEYIDRIIEAGMKISGKFFYDPSDSSRYLVEIVELDQKEHPYFIATQAHPEFLSRPSKPHPLFDGLIKAAIRASQAK